MRKASQVLRASVPMLCVLNSSWWKRLSAFTVLVSYTSCLRTLTPPSLRLLVSASITSTLLSSSFSRSSSFPSR